MDDLRAAPPVPLTIATGQAGCRPLDIPANGATAAHLVARAGERGAALLVLPELFLTGYELAAIVADPDLYTVDPADRRLEPLAQACAAAGTAGGVGAAT